MGVAAQDQILTIERRTEAAEQVLRLAGELDISSAPLLRAAVAHAAADGSSVVLDLSELEFTDASGLRAITDAHEQLGARLSLRAPSEPVRRLVRLAGLEAALLGAPSAAPAATEQRPPATGGAERIDYARRLWDAFISGGALAIAQLVPEGVEWVPWEGGGQILHSHRELRAYWEGASRHPVNATDFTDLGSDVLVRCELPAPSGGTKEIWSLLQFDGVRLLRAVSFEDRAEALAHAA